MATEAIAFFVRYGDVVATLALTGTKIVALKLIIQTL